jgi:hypothetical protein
VYFVLSEVLEMCRYNVPGLLYIPKFHTCTYKYTLYPFIFFRLSDGITSFRFKKYTGTSEFPFRALTQCISKHRDKSTFRTACYIKWKCTILESHDSVKVVFLCLIQLIVCVWKWVSRSFNGIRRIVFFPIPFLSSFFISWTVFIIYFLSPLSSSLNW